jgi:transposase
MAKGYKSLTPTEKVELVRRHLLDGIPVSQICEEEQMLPGQFHQLLQQFFHNGANAFEVRRGPGRPAKYGVDYKIREMERKLLQKDEVLAELMAEHVALKKKLGLG